MKNIASLLVAASPDVLVLPFHTRLFQAPHVESHLALTSDALS
jgi:hypothetical protein